MEELGQLTVQEILVCGGLGHNRMFLQCQANVVALPVKTSVENDPVLVGAAMLAAAAYSGRCHTNALRETTLAMAGDAHTTHPMLDTKE